MTDWGKKLSAAADALETARARRDDTIRSAAAAGMKQGQIADAVRLSRMQVSRILNPK